MVGNAGHGDRSRYYHHPDDNSIEREFQCKCMASRVFHIELLRWVEVSGNPPETRRILIWNWDIFDDN
jgi:hypothetical protein